MAPERNEGARKLVFSSDDPTFSSKADVFFIGLKEVYVTILTVKETSNKCLESCIFEKPFECLHTTPQTTADPLSRRTMTESQAWVFSQRGLPWDVLNLTTRPIPALPPPLPLPSDVPKPEEWILVKVAFVGLNPGAIFQMTLVPPFIRQASCVPEMDFSGTVIDVWHPDDNAGEASKRFKKGDKILAMLPASHTLPTGTGALAQYVRIPARYAVHKPENVSFGDGAGCLLPGLTARQLVNESGAKAGNRVLVNAASGGIGTNVVQMLRKVVGKEGYIVGICSGKNAEMVKSIGADEVSE